MFCLCGRRGPAVFSVIKGCFGCVGYCVDGVWMVWNGWGVDSGVWVVADEVLTRDGHIIVR